MKKILKTLLCFLYMETILICNGENPVKYKYHVIYYDSEQPYVEWIKEEELLELLYTQNRHILLLHNGTLNINDLVKKFTIFSEKYTKEIININASTFNNMIDGFIGLLNKTEVKIMNKTISTIFNDVFHYFNMQQYKTMFLFHNAKVTNVLLQHIDQYVTEDMYEKVKVVVTSDERDWDFTKYATFHILKLYKDESVKINNATFIIDNTSISPGRLHENKTSSEIIMDIRKNWTNLGRVKRTLEPLNISLNDSIRIWPWMEKLLRANKKTSFPKEQSEEQWSWVNDQLLQFNSKNLVRNS